LAPGADAREAFGDKRRKGALCRLVIVSHLDRRNNRLRRGRPPRLLLMLPAQRDILNTGCVPVF